MLTTHYFWNQSTAPYFWLWFYNNGTLLILYSLGEFFYFFKMDNICETHCRRSQQQQMPSQQQLRMLRQPTKLYRRLPNADQLAEIELRQEFFKPAHTRLKCYQLQFNFPRHGYYIKKMRLGIGNLIPNWSASSKNFLFIWSAVCLQNTFWPIAL